MFTTFLAATPHAVGEQIIENSIGSSFASSRSKRHQVTRACSWCRTYRIRCDDRLPCRNCVTRGRQCTEKGGNEVRTFSLALKEIHRLKSRVTELEEQLNQQQYPWKNSAIISSLPEHLDPLREHGGNRGSWQYVQTGSANSQQTLCYGPASSVYFMNQMNSYLDKVLPENYSQHTVQSVAAFSSLLQPMSSCPSNIRSRTLRRITLTDQKPLSRWQEDYFLDLFWQSYHCMYPLLDEAEFRAHHNSLWNTPYEPRKSSALVDILLAICMQYGTAFLPPDHTNIVVSAEGRERDAASSGRSLYRRCQALLQDDHESPSIMTLQCRFFSVIYLSNAGSHNAAHNMLALACRTGVTLGFHREPIDELEKNRKDFQRRLWWTTYAFEMKVAMELGRPLAINLSQVTCSLPADTSLTGSVSIPGLSASQEFGPCYTSNLHFVELILATRSVYVTFYDKCADLLGPSHKNSLYENSMALESCAGFLSTKMGYLKTWLDQVPDSLKAKRREAGEQFSTDGSPLYLQQTIPFLQQRQQLFLELHYHTMAMNLFRPFICFFQSRAETPLTEANAISGVDHAITITDIIHQCLTETGLLFGWLESFQWHGNAFLFLIGYVLAYPGGPRTPKARTAIRKAISTFDFFSNSLAVAGSMLKMAHELAAKADILVNRFHNGSVTLNPPTISSILLNPHLDSIDYSALMDPGATGAPDLSTSGVMEPVNCETLSLGFGSPFEFSDSIAWTSTRGNDLSDMWALGMDPDVDPSISWMDGGGSI